MGITISHLNKSYGDKRVLHDINIASPDGEFLVLVGASGCGKSTLLACIGGLDTIDGGTIRNGDTDITALAPKARDIAMVFQSYALYPNMTAADNIAFGLKIRKLSSAQIADKIKEVADILQITDLLARKPAQLSGGQKQRVAMGRAIARDPSLYLFDEPLSNLDAKLRVDMRLEIKKLHKRTQKNVVYVTHDQIEAMTLADRIAIMREGSIVQIGTPDEVYFRPCNSFVAKFIGANPINFLRCEITAAPDKPEQPVFYLSAGGADGADGADSARVAVPVPPSLAAYRGREVLIGIRPESIGSATPDARIKIPSPVELEEKTGADNYIFTHWNGVEIKARCTPGTSGQSTDKMELSFDAADLLFFDADGEDEKRID